MAKVSGQIVRLPNSLLIVGAIICFAEIVRAPRNSDPGPWAAAVLGVLLLRRAIITKTQPWVVIVSGLLLAALMLAGDHGLLNINNPGWIVLMLTAFACYGFWERIEKLWK
jgi:hypothetical protein